MTYDQAANLTANGYTKTGYSFKGWNTQSDGGGTAYTDGQNVVNMTAVEGEKVTLYAQWRANNYTIQFDGNTADGGDTADQSMTYDMLYAQWKPHQYTVKFDGNTADGGGTASQTMTYDQAVNLTANGYRKTGYTFTGWNTQSDGGGAAYTDGQNVKNLTIVDGENITLYAQWQANHYTVTFNGNTADGGSTASQIMTYDTAANLTANGYTKTGYTFISWNTQQDGGGATYTDGENVKNLTSIEGDTVKLYAQWQANSYTVKFDGNTADGGSTANQAMTYDQAANLTANGYTKTGYTFNGWNTQSDGGGTMTYDQAANLTANGYTKTGYTFNGWNTQSDGGGTSYTNVQNVINLTATEGETVTLYAQWRANSYTVKFDGNTADGGSTANQAMTYDTAADLTLNGYTKTGYTFTGWTPSSSTATPQTAAAQRTRP